MRVENILPYERYTLLTKLSKDEVFRRLSKNIDAIPGFRFSFFKKHSLKEYEGLLAGDTFKVKRVIEYRNSFLPIVTGQIIASTGKTYIVITMRLTNIVLIFISIWLGIVGLVCIGLLLSLAFNFYQVSQDSFQPSFFIPFGMFAFGYLLTLLSFKYETKKTRDFLAKLLEGQENVRNL